MALSLPESTFQTYWLVTNYSPTMNVNWANEKHPKDFSTICIGHRTWNCSCLVPAHPSTQQEPSDKQACFVCPSHDCFSKTPRCFYLFILNTNHFVSCWFPFMQANLMGFLLSLEFTSSVTWMALVWGSSSDSVFSRSMMYSVKVRIL